VPVWPTTKRDMSRDTEESVKLLPESEQVVGPLLLRILLLAANILGTSRSVVVALSDTSFCCELSDYPVT